MKDFMLSSCILLWTPSVTNCHPDSQKPAGHSTEYFELGWWHKKFFSFFGFTELMGLTTWQDSDPAGIAEFLCNDPSGYGENFSTFFYFERTLDRDHSFLKEWSRSRLFSPLSTCIERTCTTSIHHIIEMAVQLQTLTVDAFQSLSCLPRRFYHRCHDKETRQSTLRLQFTNHRCDF